MFLEKSTNTFLSKETDSPEFSGKFWGKFLKKLTSIATGIIREVPLIGGFIADEIENLTKDVNWDFKTTEYQLTDAENNIVDSWMQKRFGPWIRMVADNLSTALQSSNFNVQLDGMNKAMISMCAAKAYYVNGDKAGLSAEAVNSRNGTINMIFLPIEQLINTTISTFPIPLSKVAFNSGALLVKADMYPAIATYNTVANSYPCSKYVLPSGVNVGNSIFAPSTTSIIPTANPVIDIIEFDNGATPVTTIPTLPPGTTIPAGTPVLIPMNPTSETKPATTDKTFLQKNGVWLAIALVGAWALQPEKKKSKSK